MNGDETRTVTVLIEQIAAAINTATLGYVDVAGTLTDWRRHRYGTASAELVVGTPPTARLRLGADKHTASAIEDTFIAAGRRIDQARPVVAYGHVRVDPRWGLQLRLSRIELVDSTTDDAVAAAVHSDNHRTRWPTRIAGIGLIDPEHGDDARADVLGVLADCDLTVIEHRVPVTGPNAPIRISRALDQLARDHRTDITLVARGGGADIDLAMFDHPAVVAAITRHPRPVITGLGHATNHTATDEAAHTSAITPTAAATLIREFLDDK